MSIALREENFAVINIGSSITTAGIGMHDTNKPPTVSVNMANYNYPIKNNKIVNWKDLEECWHNILFKELNIKKSRNESPVLLTVPVEWTKLEHERITQIFFENFNVPGIYIAPQPLLTLFGCGAVSGVVIDIGSEVTDVNVIVDSNVQSQSSFAIPVGGNDFDRYLLELLKKDTTLVEQFASIPDVDLDIEFAKFIRESPGIYNVSVGHEVMNNKLKAELSSAMEELPTVSAEELLDEDNPKKADEEDVGDFPENVEIEYKEHKFTIGPYRHQVLDPLFSPSLLNIDSLSVPEAMRLAIMNCEPPEIRPKIWENIAIAGGCCMMAGIPKRIKTEVNLFLPHSDNAGDTQPRQLNFLRIPDYFTVLKDKKYQQYSTWLGAEIVAKLVFMDAKNYISKVDYNESGPSVVHTKTY
ncbi:MAG: actin family [Benjaminiella poitrasii]|nr:MAG: actin family [Benjaminiella poitrasii]